MTTEKFATCPACGDPGPHLTVINGDGAFANCNCGEVWEPTL